MSNGFTDTIEKLRGEIGSHISALKNNPEWAQVEKLYRALGTIEELADVPRSTLADLFGFAEAHAAGGGGARVKPGEFIGMPAIEAAKAYMGKKKAEAATLDEIMEAIKTGGANSATRESVATSLARSTWDVVKAPGQELYQLVKYTPQVRRGKKRSAGAQADTKAVESGEEQAEDGGEEASKASA
jgi:hypothetical protein